MADQTRERVELYRVVPSPGETIPVNVEPTDINDDTPQDEELREVVRGMRMRNGRAGGASRMQAEYLKEWLRDMMTEEARKAAAADGNGDSTSDIGDDA